MENLSSGLFRASSFFANGRCEEAEFEDWTDREVLSGRRGSPAQSFLLGSAKKRWERGGGERGGRPCACMSYALDSAKPAEDCALRSTIPRDG